MVAVVSAPRLKASRLWTIWLILVDMDKKQVVAALEEVLNGSPRPPALAGLSRPRYPMRELTPQQLPDGTLSVRLTKWGREYKHRGPRPKKPYPSNPAAVRAALSGVLLDGVTIQAVEDHGTHLKIYMEETL